jgi:hypothetical protein
MYQRTSSFRNDTVITVGGMISRGKKSGFLALGKSTFIMSKVMIIPDSLM